VWGGLGREGVGWGERCGEGWEENVRRVGERGYREGWDERKE
jgi:hypothetical protein